MRRSNPSDTRFMDDMLRRLTRTSVLLLVSWWLCLIGAGSLATAAPLNGQLRFAHLTTSEGLSAANVTSIAQSGQGFIWFATPYGLDRYDGYTLVHYRQGFQANQLASSWINRLFTDRDGTVWVATDRGLHRYNASTGDFTRFIPKKRRSDGDEMLDVLAIASDGQQGIWAGTRQGLQHLNAQTGDMMRLTDITHGQTLRSEVVRALVHDKNGMLWIGTATGVDLLSADRQTLTHLPAIAPPGAPPAASYVRALFQDSRGDIWAGTMRGLARWSDTTQSWTRYGIKEGFTDGVVEAFTEDQQGVMWIGTSGRGVIRFDPATAQTRTFSRASADPDSLSDNVIDALLYDRSGSLWIGTYTGGVSRLELASGGFERYIEQAGVPFGLPNSGILGVTLAPGREDIVWLASFGGGLGRINMRTGQSALFRHDPHKPDSLPDDKLDSVLFDREHRMWVGGMSGLCQFDPTRNHCQRFPLNGGEPDSNKIQSLYEASDGRLWVSTLGGAYRLDTTSGHIDAFRHDPTNPASLTSNSIDAVAQDAAGNIWIATWNGLDRYNPQTNGFEHVPLGHGEANAMPSDHVAYLHLDAHGRLWAGSEGGLSQITTFAGGAIGVRNFVNPAGQQENVVQTVTEDAQGFLWLGLAKGLARFDPATGQFRQYSVNDGLFEGNYFGQAPLAKDGTIYFGNLHGLTAFQPATLRTNPFAPPVVITDLQLFNRSVTEPDLTRRLKRREAVEFTRHMTLQYSDNVLSIEFAGLNYADSRLNRYAYRLVGFGEKWTYVGADRRFVTYTHLDPGHYRFEVKAANKDGVWSDVPTTLDITIAPPFWATWWFRVLVAISLVALLALLYRQRVRSLTEQNLALEARVDARTAELNQAVQEQQAILDNALTGIAFLRSDTIVRCNRSFEQLFGYAHQELVGMPVARLLADLDSPSAGLASPGQRNGVLADMPYLRRDGQRIWCVSHAKLVDADDPEQGLVWVVMDVTARREAELALQHAKERAEVATQAKSSFLANMSHEIRTPMNAVIGLAHLALQTKLSPKQRDYVGKIHRAGQSLLRLINDILDFSKIEAGKLDVEIVPFSLDEVLANIATITSQKAADKRIEYLFHIAPEVPRQLKGDPLRLGQVLVNLVNNAIKFTDAEGEISLDIKLLETGSDTVKLRFTVNDTGIGISAEQQSRLFQPFTQADDSISRKYGGTGLGLSISHRLVELMGGTIAVDSAIGQGSRFFVDLRFDVAAGESLAPLPDRLAGARVLVVDDSAPARAVLADALTMLGLQVDAVESAPAALDAIRAAQASQPYRAVFTDWQMPDMDGLALIRSVKADTQLVPPPKLVLVTAFSQDDVQRQADDAGADGLLLKPIGPSVLHDTLAEVFASPESADVAATALGAERHSGHRILLAEDNPINQQIATELLQAVGIAVDIAHNGHEAVNMALAVPPGHYALVLMDLQMPLMDGHQATSALRMNRELDRTPIVALTAHAIGDVRERCLAEGMQDFLTKPLHPDHLYRLVDRWIPKPDHADAAVSAEAPAVPAPPPPPTAAAPVPEIDLSRFTEIDAELGLRYMGGKRSLFVRLLGRFRQGEADAVASLQRSMAAAEWEDAQRRVHTLKGLAASMGAHKVQVAAEALETALGHGADADRAELDRLLDALDAALTPLLHELTAQLDSTPM
jgi:PAS domain S-box-containing protein